MMSNMVEEWAEDVTSISSENFKRGMASQDIEMQTRYMWKFATLHDIYGTPLYVLNGVQDSSLESFEDWSKTLDGLLDA